MSKIKLLPETEQRSRHDAKYPDDWPENSEEKAKWRDYKRHGKQAEVSEGEYKVRVAALDEEFKNMMFDKPDEKRYYNIKT